MELSKSAVKRPEKVDKNVTKIYRKWKLSLSISGMMKDDGPEKGPEKYVQGNIYKKYIQ